MGHGIRTARGGRRRGALVAVALSAALVVGLTACEQVTFDRINDVRAGAGRPDLVRSDVLRDAARAHSQAMCTEGAPTPSASPAEAYDQESAVAVHELVGAAPLDPTVTDAGDRNGRATNAIWEQWADDPELAATRWDDLGVGEVGCADGNLYLTAVLRDTPTVPASGRYAATIYADNQIQAITGVPYGSAVDYQGVNQTLLLDVYLPPNTTPAIDRPTIVLVHGGAFAGGDRSSNTGVAREWARKGYVAVSISYRLDPRLAMSPRPPGVTQLGAAANAIDDAMESVRFLKANAVTYRIDTTRIAMVGYSAGGAIAIGVAVADDVTPGGPLATQSPKIAAAVSTGAHLTPGIDAGVLTFQPADAPTLMFHHETDEASGTGEHAFRTCAAIRTGGSTCNFVLQPGEGHTTDLNPSSYWWTSQLGPFIWNELRLG